MYKILVLVSPFRLTHLPRNKCFMKVRCASTAFLMHDEVLSKTFSFVTRKKTIEKEFRALLIQNSKYM